ncbi:hypothetical protein F5887DRAFT_1076095 [Amanita rubescens]|nr:hypothetical protein F5887DRAFT_1076095 [Amanita rubescens]
MANTWIVAHNPVVSKVTSLHERMKRKQPDNVNDGSHALRPGTLLLMKVQLLTFELPDRQNDGIRKIYQFFIERIRVVANSEEDIDAPNKGSNSSTTRITATMGQRDETDDALDGLFATKKRKVTTEDENGASTSASLTAKTAEESVEKAEKPSTSKGKSKRGKAKDETDKVTRGGKGKGKKREVSPVPLEEVAGDDDNDDGHDNESDDVEMKIADS